MGVRDGTGSKFGLFRVRVRVVDFTFYRVRVVDFTFLGFGLYIILYYIVSNVRGIVIVQYAIITTKIKLCDFIFYRL